jgi:heptosyltransferase I
MRVLIVKVSSLGDIIHTLPAVTDAARARRGLRFDWVVEEAFADIPSWHPAVDKVIPVALRRWRKNPFQCWRSGEFSEFRRNLKEEHYDLVIDAQGLIKSGLISRLARGLTVGLSNRTVREPLATLFYNVVYTVPWQQHAVERVRDLFSRAFNYAIDLRQCDYGLDVRRFMHGADVQTRTPYVMFFHGTTWESKLWPVQYWQQLAQLANAAGYGVKVLWGNALERDRAHAIAGAAANVTVLERQSMQGIAGEIARCAGVVSVDTGFAHLAAAFALPVVSLYGASDASLTGTYGKRQLHLKASLPCSPCRARICEYKGDLQLDEFAGERFSVKPACYRAHSPRDVWHRLSDLMAGGEGSLDTLFNGR